MVFDFVFQEEVVQKSQFIDWLVDKLQQAGWVYETADRPRDLFIFTSTGEDGQQNIRLQIKDYYRTSSANRFQTGTTGTIGIRTFHTYTPATTTTGAGSIVPNATYQEPRLCSDVSPQNNIHVNYHINKDRMILATESGNTTTNSASCFFAAGKLYNLHDINADSATHVIVSHSQFDPEFAGRGFIKGQGVETNMTTHSWVTFPNLVKSSGNITMSELVVRNNLVGLTFMVENIFHVNFYGKEPQAYYNGTIIQDAEGRVYKLLSNPSSYAKTADFKFFAIRVG